MLCHAVFLHFKYVNVKALDQPLFSESDPGGLGSWVGEGIVPDEIQRVPRLHSYLQIPTDVRSETI